MGFLLKIVFIYFLIKFLWSVSRGPIIRKLQKYIAKLIERKMSEQNQRPNNDQSYTGTTGENKNSNRNSRETFESENKVLKK